MQYLGHNSTESICYFLEFTFSWASRILLGNLIHTSCLLQTSSLGQAQVLGEKYKLDKSLVFWYQTTPDFGWPEKKKKEETIH